MAVAITQDGERFRVEWLTRWYTRLPSLLLLVPSACLFYAVFLILRDVAVDVSRLRETWGLLLFCLGLGLLMGVPGLIVATLRTFIDLDRLMRQVTVVRQFGPLQFRRPRKLSEFKFISITDDCDEDGAPTSFNVNLCGNRGTAPIRISAFRRREEATGLANELGGIFKLPARDYVGTEPDDE